MTNAPTKTQKDRPWLIRTYSKAIANLKVYAPFAGTVVTKDAEVGETIMPGGMGLASGRGSVATLANLEQLEVDVPGDVSVIGFDNVPFSRYSRPALSTIAQDTMKAGRLMVSKLLDHGGATAGRSERVPTDLIVRETCGG